MNFPSGTTGENLTPEIMQAMAWDIPENEAIRFVIYQLEAAATTGQLHYQGYVEFNKPVRHVTAQTLLSMPRPAHFTVCKGTSSQNIAYCSKADTRIDGPWTHGNPKTQGKRTDLMDACETLKSDGLKAVAELHPTSFVKYHGGFRELEAHLKKVSPIVGFEPRTWQKKALALFLNPPNDRTIYWVYDPPGGQGKSTLAKFLICNHDAIVLDGKMSDMAYMLGNQKIVIFDVCRSQNDNMNHLYRFAEQLKNGVWTSPKYQSRSVVSQDPRQVIFFSNMTCPDNAFSLDRVHLIDLTLTEWHVEEPLSPDLFDVDSMDI
jgi:hypothetical protein